MTDTLDRALRVAVNDLADGGRPVNLAGAALRRGRAVRRRQRTAAVVAVAALVLGMAIVAIRNPGPGAQRVAAPGPSASADAPTAYPGGYLLGAYRDRTGAMRVLDRATGTHRTVPYRMAVPAPRGDLVAVWDDGPIGILNTATDEVRWLAHTKESSVDPGMWSPDGTRFVYAVIVAGSAADRNPTADFVVVDARSGARRAFTTGAVCDSGCVPFWMDEQTFGIDVPGGTSVTVYSAVTGERLRGQPMCGFVGRRWAGAPAGGRYTVARVHPPGADHVRVVICDDRAPDAPIRLDTAVADVYWIDGDRILALRSGGVQAIPVRGSPEGLPVYPWPSLVDSDRMGDVVLVRA